MISKFILVKKFILSHNLYFPSTSKPLPNLTKLEFFLSFLQGEWNEGNR